MHLEELDVVEYDVPHSAAMNMAIDEALLQSAVRPTLRFFCWLRPALSFGYFGSFADVAHQGGDRDVVRRWTGGGIVLHGDDLTYSVVVPGRLTISSNAVYSHIHGAIRMALPRDMNIVLAAEAAPKLSEACFANPVEADVMFEGRKIAGAAQRRTRTGLLHQGSIQDACLPADFPKRFPAALCGSFRGASLSRELVRDAQTIADRRYSTTEWLHQR